MKLSQFKKHLSETSALQFQLPNGEMVPAHFHITEAGQISKRFVDCGGNLRSDDRVNFQIWVAEDTDHRLTIAKLIGIIGKYEKLFGSEDLDVEFEYQSGTIGKYFLDFENGIFLLINRETACLASDKCTVPEKDQAKLVSGTKTSCC